MSYLSKEHQKEISAVVLRSLKIDDEKERALACVHLVPHLPDSQLSVYLPQVIQAVDIVLPRTARQSLAAVAIQEERERMLAPLLSLLARQGSTQKAIELAEERESKAQVTALAGLVGYLPLPLRDQIFWRSYAIARAHNLIGDWAEALGDNSLCLSNTALHQLEKEIETMDDVATKAQTLAALARHFSETERSKIAQQLLLVEFDELPSEIVVKVVPWLPAVTAEIILNQTLTEAFKQWKRDNQQIWDLKRIVPHLPFSKLQEVFELILAAQESSGQVLLLASFVARLSEPQRSETAVMVCNNLPKARLNMLAEAQVLGDIILFLPEQLQNEIIERALHILFTFRGEWKNRVETDTAVKTLACNLAQLPPEKLYSAWYKELTMFAKKPRKELLNGLEDLIPLIITIGGKDTVGILLQAVMRVGQWWP